MSIARYVRPQVRLTILAGSPPAWLKKHSRRTYIEQCIVATPPWVKHRDFLELQREKEALTMLTGIEHVMDHIIPLKHPYVCGLNVPWNIQIITRQQNAAKSNKWCPDQMDLFLEGK